MDPLEWEKRQEELKQYKKDERKRVNPKAKKAALAISTREKNKEILEIQQE